MQDGVNEETIEEDSEMSFSRHNKRFSSLFIMSNVNGMKSVPDKAKDVLGLGSDVTNAASANDYDDDDGDESGSADGSDKGTFDTRDLVTVMRTNPSLILPRGLLRIALTASALTLAFSFGLHLTLTWSALYSLGAFITVWSLFHWCEFVMTALYHPQTVTAEAFLINHSRQFHLALALSIVEYVVESIIFAGMKHSTFSYLISTIGIVGALCGEALRIYAMVECGPNFTHVVQHNQRAGHKLITTGPYAYVRHPAYSGWFIWSLSTQLILCNPVCLVGYAFVTWQFFAARIDYEEQRMLTFFGDSYRQYQRTVQPGIPFLQYFKIPK